MKMKPGNNLITGLVLGLLAGILLMGLYDHHAYQKKYKMVKSVNDDYWDRMLYLQDTCSIVADLNTLRALRAGGTSYLIASTEQSLSQGIEKLMSDYPQKALSDPTTADTLKLVSKYNDKYPLLSGDTNTDQKVITILKAAGEKP